MVAGGEQTDWANNPPEGFDWDPAKYAEALMEHRVRLEIAALVFDDPYLIEAYDDRQPYGVGRIGSMPSAWPLTGSCVSPLHCAVSTTK